jgi:hypothetical protein
MYFHDHQEKYACALEANADTLSFSLQCNSPSTHKDSRFVHLTITEKGTIEQRLPSHIDLDRKVRPLSTNTYTTSKFSTRYLLWDREACVCVWGEGGGGV